MSEELLSNDLSVTAEIKLYYDLYIPENAVEPAPLLIAVHGYGAHKRYMMREARRIAPDGFAVVSLQAPHQHFRETADGYRVGFGWLTDHRPEESVALHHNFVNEVLAKMDAEGIADPDNFHLFGFSQACALNFRYASAFPDKARSVIGVCGGIPGDLETNPNYRPFDAETFYLYGNDDEFYSEERFRSFDEKLGSILPNYRSKRYEAKHEITEEMRSEIRDFLDGMRSV